MRSQLRTIVAGVVIVVIGVALLVETPGTVESIGFVVVVLAMILVIVRERRGAR
jgi:EamA domain-containing membrane protein RarD